MSSLFPSKVTCVAITLLILTAASTQLAAQVFTTLARFNGFNGDEPTGLTQGPDGYLYGVTTQGGDLACMPTNGCGTVFKISPAGMLITLHVFELSDGWFPTGGLILGRDGNFYGTTRVGGDLTCLSGEGCGTVFRISPTGLFKTLYAFSPNGASLPEGPLVQAPDGDLYGITSEGGDFNCINPYGCGTIFKITTSGTLTIVHEFEGGDGAFPQVGLTLGMDGNFYGTAAYGGDNNENTYGAGTLFKMTPDGSLTTLHYFCSRPRCYDGIEPYGTLVQNLNRRLLGTTLLSAVNYECDEGCGTIFAATSDGAFKTLHVFKKKDGWDPGAMIQATDGNLYGMTGEGGDLVNCYPSYGCGTIFRLAPDGTFSSLFDFELSDGTFPNGPLVQATNGILYGTTQGGGFPTCFEACGTIFSYSLGLAPFVSLVHNPAKVGQSFGILGQGFLGTTRVSVNGVQTSYTVKSDTALTAIVPAGAMTGFVTVVTTNGTLTSNQRFVVLP